MLDFLKYVEHNLNSVSNIVGQYIPWLMIPFVLITFITAILRYSFDYGEIAIQEISSYLHAIILMLCIAYTQQQNEHVRIDIFYQHLSSKGKAMINLFGCLVLLLPTCLTILIISSDYALRSWLLLEHSLENDGLPLVFILKSLIPAMAILLLIQGLAELARDLRKIIKP